MVRSQFGTSDLSDLADNSSDSLHAAKNALKQTAFILEEILLSTTEYRFRGAKSLGSMGGIPCRP